MKGTYPCDPLRSWLPWALMFHESSLHTFVLNAWDTRKNFGIKAGSSFLYKGSCKDKLGLRPQDSGSNWRRFSWAKDGSLAINENYNWIITEWKHIKYIKNSWVHNDRGKKSPKTLKKKPKKPSLKNPLVTITVLQFQCLSGAGQ